MTAAVSLVDYGVGNLGSVRNMFKRIGVPTEDIADPDALPRAARVLLPGVGAFDHGMSTLVAGGWVDALRDHAAGVGCSIDMRSALDASSAVGSTGAVAMLILRGLARSEIGTRNTRTPAS